MIARQKYGDIRYNSPSSPQNLKCSKKTIFGLVLFYLFCIVDCYIAYDWINYIGERSLAYQYDASIILDLVNHYNAMFISFAIINTIASFFIIEFFYKLEDGPNIKIVSNSFWIYIVLSIILFAYYLFQSIFFWLDGSLICLLPIVIGLLLFPISILKTIIF
jgi:hypothetical protein